MSEEKGLTVYQQTRQALDGWAKEHITAVLPANMTWERFRAKALHALMVSPQVRGCDSNSIVMSVMKAAGLGLEIGTQAHLVPFKTTCTFIPDYKGLTALMYRAGCRRVTARSVYKGDEFDYQYGTDEFIHHKPSMQINREDQDLEYAYCIVVLPNGETVFRVIDRSEILKTKNRSSAGKSGPWVTDFEAMAIKTAIKRTAPFIQIDSPQLLDALDAELKADLAHESGNHAVIDAEYKDVDDFVGDGSEDESVSNNTGKREKATINLDDVKPAEKKEKLAPSEKDILVKSIQAHIGKEYFAEVREECGIKASSVLPELDIETLRTLAEKLAERA